jgi:peptidyl-prolyl cis-trans isomerase SurA
LTSIRREMIQRGVTSGSARIHRIFIRRLVIAAGCIFAATAAPSRAHAQVVLVVNGEVITNYDIEQRAKFNTMAVHKTQSRQETLEELIDDKLKAQVARRYKIDLTDKDVDGAYEDRAKGMKISPEQLTQILTQSGIDAKTFKAKLLADMSWQYIIRGRFQQSFQISETSINEETEKEKKGAGSEVGYDLTLRPILFLVPKGNAALMEARRKDADALRGRFVNCDTGLPLARSLRDVVIRDSVNKNSSDLLPALREILNKTELGHLTPPETTEQGIQVFAVCEKKETKSETPEKRAALQKIMAERFDAKSKAYLKELRRQAIFERK